MVCSEVQAVKRLIHPFHYSQLGENLTVCAAAWHLQSTDCFRWNSVRVGINPLQYVLLVLSSVDLLTAKVLTSLSLSLHKQHIYHMIEVGWAIFCLDSCSNVYVLKLYRHRAVSTWILLAQRLYYLRGVLYVRSVYLVRERLFLHVVQSMESTRYLFPPRREARSTAESRAVR